MKTENIHYLAETLNKVIKATQRERLNLRKKINRFLHKEKIYIYVDVKRYS